MHDLYNMENLVMSTVENYGVYENHLWHISYAINLWLNVAMEGFVMGLMLGWYTMQFHSECRDLVRSGGQGGALIAPRKMWEKSLICWVWLLCDSFGFSFGCLRGFEFS